MIVYTSSAIAAVDSTRPGRSARGALRVAGGRHEAGRRAAPQQRHRRHREEDARPREAPQQPAAEDRAERDRHPGRGAPQADRAGTLGALGEDVADQRQRRGEHQRGAEAHHAARGDQLPGARGEARPPGWRAEQRQPGEQGALAPDAVGQAAGGEQERGEHEVVGVDDPLQLAVGRVQFAHQRGQRHVDDRGVEVDREGGQEQGCENQGAAVHQGELIDPLDKKIKSLDKLVQLGTLCPCVRTASTAR